MMTFEEWLRHVDWHISDICGLTHRDLADQTWHDWFDGEYTPREAAEEALANEGFRDE